MRDLHETGQVPEGLDLLPVPRSFREPSFAHALLLVDKFQYAPER